MTLIFTHSQLCLHFLFSQSVLFWEGALIMNLRIAICDDDNKILRQINSHLFTYSMKHDDNFDISCYSSADELLNDYNGPGSFHVMLLDVEMPGMSGLELGQVIRNKPDRSVRIVYISNYPEYMQESFNVRAFYYLNKPVEYSRLSDVLDRIMDDYKGLESCRLTVESDNGIEVIDFIDILYIEALKDARNRLRLVMNTGELITRGNLSDYTDIQNNFYHVHRSYIVNLLHVHRIEQTTIYLDNNDSIPLSRRRQHEFKQLFSKQILKINQQSY